MHAACVLVLPLRCVLPEPKGCSCPVQLLLAIESCGSPDSEVHEHRPPVCTLTDSQATAACMSEHPVPLLCKVSFKQIIPPLLLSELCGPF